jgi:phosphoribosylformylglycinamidine synthase
MHAAVVVFPGSNADAEMIRTLRDVLGVRTSVVWHGDAALPGAVDLVALPGGFSYGDYLRCGAIARTSPVVGAVRAHAERGGLVLGVCNGFQVLTECGLLEGALTRNANLRFDCRDVHVRPEGDSPFVRGLPPVLRLPIAHAEGRYVPPGGDLAGLERRGLVALRYCARSGALADGANPNGSIGAVAGVVGGPRRNVLGLMPHPERMSEPVHGGEDGRLLFEAVVRAAAEAGGAPAVGESAP